MKNKNRLNFIIDAAMFLVMMAIIGIGLLIKYVLLPGSHRWEIYGRNVDLTLWGWDRHQWGTLHLVLGAVLCFLLVLHIVFHWKQIKSIFKLFVRNIAGKQILTALFVIVSILLTAFPFFVDITVTEHMADHTHHHMLSNPIEHNQTNSSETEFLPMDEDAVVEHENTTHIHHSINIRGSMTLDTIEKNYGISADSMKFLLNLPSDCSAYTRLGHLRRKYDLDMNRIRHVIEQYCTDMNQ